MPGRRNQGVVWRRCAENSQRGWRTCLRRDLLMTPPSVVHQRTITTVRRIVLILTGRLLARLALAPVRKLSLSKPPPALLENIAPINSYSPRATSSPHSDSNNHLLAKPTASKKLPCSQASHREFSFQTLPFKFTASRPKYTWCSHHRGQNHPHRNCGSCG